MPAVAVVLMPPRGYRLFLVPLFFWDQNRGTFGFYLRDRYGHYQGSIRGFSFDPPGHWVHRNLYHPFLVAGSGLLSPAPW